MVIFLSGRCDNVNIFVLRRKRLPTCNKQVKKQNTLEWINLEWHMQRHLVLNFLNIMICHFLNVMFTCLNVLLYFVSTYLLRCRRVKSHLAFILSQKYIQYNRYMYRHSIYSRVQYTHRKFTLNKVFSSYICFTSILIRSGHVSQSFERVSMS